MEPRLNQA